MVYGVIDKESCRYYTYLKSVFDAIENRQVEYNWLITDTEIVAHSSRLEAINTSVHWEHKDGKPIAIPAPDYYFLSGEELTTIISEDDSQWVWGVLSGFEKGIPLDEILKYPLPEAEGYEGFWKKPFSMQNALASVEIVLWDSSCITNCLKMIILSG